MNRAFLLFIAEQIYSISLDVFVDFCNFASYGSKWRVNIFAGYLKNFGTGKPCSVLYGTGTNVADVIKTAASVEFNYKGLNVALECEYSNAAYANWFENRLIEDYRVGNVKGVMRVSYSFNHTWNL